MCQLGNFKGLYLNGFSIGIVWEKLQAPQLYTSWSASCLMVSGLHDNIIFYSGVFLSEVIKEKVTAQLHSEREPTIDYHQISHN